LNLFRRRRRLTAASHLSQSTTKRTGVNRKHRRKKQNRTTTQHGRRERERQEEGDEAEAEAGHCLEGFPVLHKPDVGVVAKGGTEALWMEVFRDGIAPTPYPTVMTPLQKSHQYSNCTITDLQSAAILL